MTDGVRLIEASNAVVRFEVAGGHPRIVPSGEGTSGPVRVGIEGFGQLEGPGQPALPERIVVVAVPPSGMVEVAATGLDPETTDGVQLAEIPEVARGAGDAPSAAAATRGPAGPLARVLSVGWLRDQRIARIVVRPADWNPAARRLTTYGRVDVSVAVDPLAAARASARSAARLRATSDAALSARVRTALARRSGGEEPLEAVYAAAINAEQARGWRLDPARRRADARAAGAAVAVADTSVFAGRRWLKIAVPSTGFYKLTFAQFRRFAPFNDDTTTALDSLRLFTWSGLPVLPETTYCDTCGFQEVAMGLVDNGDGRLNQGADAIYFYGLGPSDWADRYDARQPDTVFVTNPYETRNFYYLGIGTAAQPFGGVPKRIGTRSGAITGAGATPATFPERSHQEQDALYDANDFPNSRTYAWDKWLWAELQLGSGSQFPASVDAPGIDPTVAARLRARVVAVANGFCTGIQTVGVTWNNGVLPAARWTTPASPAAFTIDQPLAPGTVQTSANSLLLALTQSSCGYPVGVSWFDLFYARRYQAVNGLLAFRPPVGGGDEVYAIDGFTAVQRPRLFDVTDPLTPLEITDFTYGPGPDSLRVSFESVDDDTRRYLVEPTDSIRTIAASDIEAAATTSLTNLRSPTLGADYLVIYYDDFSAAADSLTAWRRSHNGYATRTVPISAIYDQFSGGRTDPTAIRNFLRGAYYNWNRVPTYVQFLGDASSDFKNLGGGALAGQPGSPLPTYENGWDAFTFEEFTTDDWLLNVNDLATIDPDFFGARLPVTSASSALSTVQKVIGYERSPVAGIGRDRIMFLADDDAQGSIDDELHWVHVQQTAQIDSSYTPSALDRVYEYTHLYPLTSSLTRPAARADVINQLNSEGVAVWNFIGHGSPNKITDENVFLDSDASLLHNAVQLPLFVAASCDVGRFSDPQVTSLGERLILQPRGGAIGVVSATSLALSGENFTLSKSFYAALFARDSSGHYFGRVAAALALVKLGNTNEQKYQLMGDAAMRLGLPEEWVDLSVEDDGGRDTTAIEQGREMTYSGRILDGPNGHPVPMDGIAQVLVEDSAPLLQVPPCRIADLIKCESTTFEQTTNVLPFFYYKAGPVYRGTAEVHGGTFHGQFFVPLQARPGNHARVRAYVTGPTNDVATYPDGVGDLRVRVAPGAAPGGDDAGPTIRLSFPNDATRVKPGQALRIDLSDPHGILITEHTPQNGIVVTIDGNTTNRTEVTDSFTYSPGSDQAGTASFTLPDLSIGFHTITVSAADNLAEGLSAAQHRSQASLEFEVVQSLPLRLASGYLFPNPTSSGRGYSGGQFVVDTEGGPMDLLLRIYTVTGRLVRQLEARGVSGQAQIPWDGLDAEGQGLSNGIYVFKVLANQKGASGSGDGGSGHADLQGRLVIVNR